MNIHREWDTTPVEYLVLMSENDETFNLGGDLSVTHQGSLNGSRDILEDYAKACINVVYDNTTGLGLEIETISLIQDQAMVSGFEAVLSSDDINAEKCSVLAFPETLYGLSGDGSYQLLLRRVNRRQAEVVLTVLQPRHFMSWVLLMFWQRQARVAWALS